ncbi:MAG: hypothetical protein JW937_01010 [Candidatus Omnitrophica bacterium]|nr:hypothetical protein [Candidatus Omnitrophota bacterium]
MSSKIADPGSDSHPAQGADRLQGVQGQVSTPVPLDFWELPDEDRARILGEEELQSFQSLSHEEQEKRIFQLRAERSLEQVKRMQAFQDNLRQVQHQQSQQLEQIRRVQQNEINEQAQRMREMQQRRQELQHEQRQRMILDQRRQQEQLEKMRGHTM